MKTTTVLAILTLPTLIGCDKKSSTAKQPSQEAAKAAATTPPVAAPKPAPVTPTPHAPPPPDNSACAFQIR